MLGSPPTIVSTVLVIAGVASEVTGRSMCIASGVTMSSVSFLVPAGRSVPLGSRIFGVDVERRELVLGEGELNSATARSTVFGFGFGEHWVQMATVWAWRLRRTLRGRRTDCRRVNCLG